MSEKVLITPEQAEAIERWANKEQLIIAKASGLLEHGMDEPIAELTMKQLVKAIYIGYEVEPEFKVGDWVFNFLADEVGVVTEVGESYLKYDDGLSNTFNNFRHATPEEIAEEKERRWWSKHGREVWELREDDVLLWDKDIPLITTLTYVNGNHIKSSEINTTIDFIRTRFKVVCFAEDRLDGDFDE